MARKGVKLYIDSDVTGVKRGVGQAQSSLRGFEGQAKKSQGSMSRLSSSAAGLGLAFGATGLAIGIKTSLDAFKDQEKQMARVIATLKTLGVNTEAVRKRVLAVTDAQSKLSGFQDDELQASFSTILRVSRDTEESFKLNALAMDIARGSGKNLQVVALAIAKAVDGNANALVRYGVKAQKGATVTDVLSLAQKRYAGQAREFGNSAAGSAAKADVAIDQLQQSVGGKLAPAMEAAASATISLSGATGRFIDQAGGIGPVVSGAAGFGAFKILGPTLVNAGSAIGTLGRVAGTQGAGSSFRVLGSAIGASINPMTAAAVGAGLLAGGIYEIWHNSESAEDAIRGLHGAVTGLNTALDQKTAASDAVNNARDLAKTTGDAAVAASHHAQEVRIEVNELKRHHGSAVAIAKAVKDLSKAETTETEAIHANQRAHHNLSAALRNEEAAKSGVKVSSAEEEKQYARVAEQIRGLTRDVRVAGRSGLVWKDTVGSSATQAGILAGKLDKTAAATRNSDAALSKVDSTLASFIRRVQRMPTAKEVRIITTAVHHGDSPREIKAQLDAITSKVVTITTQQRGSPFQQRNPITGKPVASGAYVAGDYSRGDRVPAMLAGGEAVLNPLQIGMVDSGMTVMGALSATGAPTIGHSFAGGKTPRGSLAALLARGTKASRGKHATSADLVGAALEREGIQWDSAAANSALRIAQADAAGDASGNVRAYQQDIVSQVAMQKRIRAIMGHPAKALGVFGGRLSQSQRTTLTQALAQAISQVKSDNETIYGLMHPAADDSGGGGDTSTGTGAAVYDPAADLQARLEQSQRREQIAVRGGQLSEATLRTLTGPGDIGIGGGAGGPRVSVMQILGDPRSLQGFASAATQGMGLQPSRAANRASINA